MLKKSHLAEMTLKGVNCPDNAEPIAAVEYEAGVMWRVGWLVQYPATGRYCLYDGRSVLNIDQDEAREFAKEHKNGKF